MLLTSDPGSKGIGVPAHGLGAFGSSPFAQSAEQDSQCFAVDNILFFLLVSPAMNVIKKGDLSKLTIPSPAVLGA